MEITTESLPWSSDDIANWASFLSTQTGQRVLPKLLESTPGLLAKGDINEILIRSGEVRGFQDAARNLLSLSAHTPLPPSDPASNYPPLIDDAAWNDGQKIQP
jgi:hypothetical protein